jgi:hypothetical protein
MTLIEAVQAYLAAHDKWRANKDMTVEAELWKEMSAKREALREFK